MSLNISEIEHYTNHDLKNIVTPLKAEVFGKLLKESGYPKNETDFLIKGFTDGFDIGYRGPKVRQSRSKNIPFTVGDKYELWSKIMKGVKAKRFAGPYDEIPFDNYIQSPIGLVPKAGNKTRLIFHLSYVFREEDDQQSLNGCTVKEEYSVHYNDLDAAVRCCLEVSKEAQRILRTNTVYLGKTDLSSAFRVLLLLISCIRWLIMSAEDPADGKWKFFIDKCLPFGASISCSHYQRFSNALRHIVEFRTNHRTLTNYLDDFLFAAITKLICYYLINQFILLCEQINIPVAFEKTEWGTTMIVFLGILLDGKRMLLSIPLEKRDKALTLLRDIEGKRKITVKQLQILTGYLNFLGRAIFAGRTFTRRIYAKYSGLTQDKKKKIKPHYHINIDAELRFDCEVWKYFLANHSETAVCRPMVDLNLITTADQLNFYSDASANHNYGIGAVFKNQWLCGQWEPGFIKQQKPSIEYLELLGLTAAVLTWGEQLKNQRVQIFCDNEAVVNMVNNVPSSCKNCMYLLRLLVLNNLINNRRIFVKHVRSQDNDLADALSRTQYKHFWRLAPTTMNPYPSTISPLVWPVSNIWQK